MQETNHKNILFIVSQPYYQWRGSPIRVGFDTQALAELGHSVDLLVLPFGEDRNVPGVNIHRVKNFFGFKDVPIGPSCKKLMFDFILYCKARNMIREKRYDVLHGVEDAGMICALLRAKAQAKVVFEKHSDPASYRKKGLQNLVMQAYSWVEKVVIRKADAVIGTGEGLTEQVRNISPEKPAYHIPDTPSSLEESTPERTESIRERLRTSEKDILITYVGSFAVYQGIDLLFEAIPMVCRKCKQARFVIIGGSPSEIGRRQEDLKQAGVSDNVVFAGKCPPSDLPNWLTASDILLSPRIAGKNTPLKLLDYLKAGRAIVATENTANRLILNENNAVFAAPEPNAFANAILQLTEDAPSRARLAEENTKTMTQNHSYSGFRAKLDEVYKNLD